MRCEGMRDVTVDLILRVQQEEQGAFEELYDTCYPIVYAMVFKIMKNKADSEDVTQEVFVTIHSAITGLRDPKLFYAWLNRVVNSRCMNHFKKKRFISTAIAEDGLDLIQEERSYMTPQGTFSYVNDQEILNKFIYDLPVKYQDIVISVYFKQMKLEEIANEMELPVGTVKTRIKRAREILKRKISLFEKKEGRKLDFNIDTIIPSSMFGGVLLFSTIKSGFANSISSVAFAQVACVVTICIGASAVLHGTMKESELSQNTLPKEELEYVIDTQTIGPFTYSEIQVENSKEAYFLCINWASDQETMSKKTKGQFRRIKPIYDALKQQNDQYYQMLVKRNWSSEFEKRIENYQL